MDSTGPPNDSKNSIWHRKKTDIAVLGILLALSIACAITFSSLYTQNAPWGDLVSFQCSSAQGGETSTLALGINLSDGMDREEAIEVASQVFSRFLDDTRGVVDTQSALADSKGTWTVEIISTIVLQKPDWGGHTFIPRFYRFVINPFELTVEYGGAEKE